MNPAFRAVVLAAFNHNLDVWAVHRGYQGLIEAGDLIRRVGPDDVTGILHSGGTVMGTARSAEFRTRSGRRTAARNLVDRRIDSLVVIGGDGSLSGADLFRQEWPELLGELVEGGELPKDVATEYPVLGLVGLVGSIDNDVSGTDMTIGADTALHRITEAMDALRSTASSHQRTFVVEVMGRHCGYLALMASIATAANWVLIPEQPPPDDWEQQICQDIEAGRAIGRRQSVVIVAEGAKDRHGNAITAEQIRDLLQSRLDEDTRITILGHVQRGGAPTAYDRYLATLLGNAAVETLVAGGSFSPPQLVGIRGTRVVRSPLMECIAQTRSIADHIGAHDFERAMQLRGGGFREAYAILRTMQQAAPRPTSSGRKRLRLAVIHGGGPAPGMNNCVRAAVRLALNRGYTTLAVRKGFLGLRDGTVEEMGWMDVSGWVAAGGAEIGTNRWVPTSADIPIIAKQLAAHRIDGLLVAGGWSAYQAAYQLHRHRSSDPALDIPIVCLPLTINNDLPATEICVGSDTALNSITEATDKIRQSAVASRRVFVIEVMGHDCGYLALRSGLASGADRVYLPEEGITLDNLTSDVAMLAQEFRAGRRLGIIIRSENADHLYDTEFITALLQKEGGELFDARPAVLGHIQEGGDPSPFDRIEATRLTAHCIDFLSEQLESGTKASAMIGIQSGRLQFTDLTSYPELLESGTQRPKEQRWMDNRDLAKIMRG